MSFAHLHLHTAHSLVNGRDGTARAEQIIARAKKFGQPAVALTDHGVMSAAPDFYRAALEAKIQPIIGIEAYIVPDAKATGFGPNGNLRDRRNYHLTLMATTAEGYHNLVHLSTQSHTPETYFYRPRMDHSMLRAADTSGIVCLSGCAMGELAQTMLMAIRHIVAFEVPTPDEQKAAEREGYSIDKGWAWPKWTARREAKVRKHPDFKMAERMAAQVLKTYRSMFPDGQYLYEVMDHGWVMEKWAQRLLRPLAKKYGVPEVVTNDVHYLTPNDNDLGEIMRNFKWNDKLCGKPDPKHLDMTRRDQLGERLEHLFDSPKEYEAAADQTLKVADMASGMTLSAFEAKQWRIPKFRDDKGRVVQKAVSLLRSWCEPRLEKLCALYPDKADEYRARFEWEMSVIKRFRYVHMFLITADYVRWAKEQMIVGDGRGSAAGSLVAFTSGIVEIDPIRHGLLFERFLDPERASMPDFDVDFPSEDGEKVLAYLAEKYGADNLARICTFDRLRPKSVIKALGDVCDLLDYGSLNELTKRLEDDNTRKDLDYIKQWWSEQDDPTLTKMLERADRKGYDLKKLSRKMFQLPVAVSGHAAAVVIGDHRSRMQDWVPMQYVPSSGSVVTQFDMDQIESLGFVKFDVLRVGTLDTIAETIRMIGHDPFKREIDERGALSYEDPSTYELVSKIHTDGMFQLSGGTAKQAIRQIGGCRDFDDICAIMALGRPGAMKYTGKYRVNRETNWKHVKLAHPDLKDILRGSYGIFLYQEDVMALIRYLGMPSDDLNTIMHAIKKKDMHEFNEVEGSFHEHASRSGWKEEQALEVYDQIKDYAGYSFNKSHSYSYGSLAFKTAYLKANYPAYFIGAKMRQFSRQSDKKKKVENLQALVLDARRVGVKVLPPNVNKSDVSYSAPTTTKIRAGLADIKGVGVGAAKEIIKARPYKPGDFVPEREYIGPRGGQRKDPATLGKAKVHSGIATALALAGAVPGVEVENKWEAEQELLYCNISPHPNKSALRTIRRTVKDPVNLEQLMPPENEWEGYSSEGVVGGVIMRLHEHVYKQRKTTKTHKAGEKRAMAFIDVELGGMEFPIVVFADLWENEVRRMVKPGRLILAGVDVEHDEKRGLSYKATYVETWK